MVDYAIGVGKCGGLFNVRVSCLNLRNVRTHTELLAPITCRSLQFAKCASSNEMCGQSYTLCQSRPREF